MSGIRKHLRYVSFFTAMMMALGSVWSATATAGMVGTGEMIGQQQVQLDRQELISMLDRQDVPTARINGHEPSICCGNCLA